MWMIWNRKELTSTNKMRVQAELRETLAQHQIEYMVKVVNRKSPSPFAAGSRAGTGTYGENLEEQNLYIFYVHRKDYERASSFV